MINRKPMCKSVRISLNDLRFFAYHGVFEQERRVGNEFEVSVHVDIPPTDSMNEDSLEGTVSYADIYEIVRERMQTPSLLLEKVAIDISRTLQERWPEILSGRVEVRKLGVPVSGIIGDAGVEIFF